MKKTIFLTIVATLFCSLDVLADSYVNLWKQFSEAQSKDLPKSEMTVLNTIIDKAATERQYGELLKAELTNVSVLTQVSPDSLKPAVEKLKLRLKSIGENDYPAAAVYNCALGRLYRDNGSLGDDRIKISQAYFKAAMAHPQALADYKAPNMQPAIIKGDDSKLFDDDLLSVIGYETGDFATLNKYYRISGNRHGEMFSALEMLKAKHSSYKCEANKSDYLNSVDSLIDLFGDLRACGEVALEHYHFIDKCKNTTDENRIKYIRYALNKWGAYPPMNELRNDERSLTNPSFAANTKRSTIVPNEPQMLYLNDIRNLSSVTMTISSLSVNGDTELNPSNDDDYAILKKGAVLMPELTQTKKYYGRPEYQKYKDSLLISGLSAGVYMIELSTDPKTAVARCLYYVSNVRAIYEKLPRSNMRIAVVNATTGQPVSHATVRLTLGERYGRSGGNTVTLTCDEKGEALYKYTVEPNNIYAYTALDKACPDYNCWSGAFRYYDNNNQREITQLYTDRNIYRPGQTVHASAIVSTCQGLITQVVGNKKVTLTLFDANYKQVDKKDVTTDKMGTCTADFTLPSSGLTGRFHISAQASGVDNTYFRVEEYKRPTFEVTFPEVNKKYQSGDTLVVTGHARSFAGVPVQGAKVKYTVMRKQALWWRWFGSSSQTTLSADTVITDGEGAFRVEIPLILPQEDTNPMFYNFTVSADVTDVAGETQNAEMSVPLGTRPTAFSCAMQDKMLRDSANTLMFHLRNAAGNEIDASVSYRIDGGNTQTVQTRKNVTLPSLTSGRHHLMAVCEKDTLKQDFIVFGMQDTKPCVETKDWFYQSAKEFPRDSSTPVTVQIGSSDPDVHILYNIISENRVIESGVIDQSKVLCNRSFTYKNEYGSGLLINYAWMKDGVCYRHTAEIRRPMPEKRLLIKWTTFRDRLTPGQKEEWKLNITRADGKPVEAQLMATLYDKSLDEIVKNNWSFNNGMWQNFPYANWDRGSFGHASMYAAAEFTSLKVTPLSFSHFDDSMFDIYTSYTYTRSRGKGGIRLRGVGQSLMANAPVMMAKSQALNLKEVDLASIEPRKVSDYGSLPNGDLKGSIAGLDIKKQASTSPQVRENLSETAFFYPQLMTDGKGAVSIKFTLPESLTTWRFMGLAHTADMCSGMIDGEAVAKKDVMVQPDMPRFVRVGDCATIVARIINTSDKQQSGTAIMQLLDPETDKIIFTSQKPFSVNANETQTVTFDYAPDDAASLLICKIFAQGKTFSDGEQHYLPILPNSERVTVTVPFTQNNPGTKSIDLQKLFPQQSADGQQSKLTVEYTNNPAWLMIQALPSMSVSQSDNVISQCQSYYSSVIGQTIMASSPKIKTIVESWKSENRNENSMMSNLQKNQELKDFVLNETPWVADADNESSQKQQLIGYFDENTLNTRTASALEKMQQTQNPDGSWSWFRGMEGSMYMTTTVAEMLVRLNSMCGVQDNTRQMLDNAFRFMGKDIVKMVNEMKREERKGYPQTFPGSTALHYLYLCALDGRSLSPDVRDASAYLISLMKKEIKDQSIYDKALSAIILQKDGNTTKAKEYAQSLKEYSVMTEEMGRYYDTGRAHYSWCDYKIPTEVAAIEALKSITPEDKTTVDEMLRWLLQEKRTQSWDTPINSVNAVYAFLKGNISVLAGQEKTELAIDGKKLAAQTATAGIGYVKTALQPTSKMKTFTAKKTSTGTSWGAVYAQFMQKTSEIEKSNSGMTVKREIIGSGKELKVGDKVKVRLTITADRDYDFVQVLDRRAACMEPVKQLSGYHWGYYCAPKDCSTNYYFDNMNKGTHVIETEYYIDRSGQYETGTCTAQCAYSPEYRATAKSVTLNVK